MKSKIFSSDHLKIQLRFGGFIPVLLGVCYLLAFPVAELLMIGNWTQDGYTVEQIRLLTENLFRDGLCITGMIVTVGAAFLIALWNFFYLYSRDKVDYYHSQPVSRTHLFLQKLIIGLLYFLIPYVIMLFLTLVAGGLRGYFQISMCGLALVLLVKHTIAWLFTYFCTALVIAMTGNILMGILSLGGFCLYGPVLGLLLGGMEDEFFRTAAMTDTGLAKVIFLICPFTVYVWIYEGRLVAGILLTVLFGVFSWLAYSRRPSESTGKSMVYHWFAQVIKFLVVIPGGLGIGLIFGVIQNNKSAVWWIFGLVLGTVMVKGLIEVLYELDFKAFFRKKGELALCLAFVAMIILIFKFDLLGYNTYIPAYSRIAGIRVERFTESSYDTDLVIKDGVVEANQWDHYLCKDDSELGRQVYEVLAEMAALGGEVPDDSHVMNAQVEIKLKSGLVVSRMYPFTPEQTQKLNRACYEETNLKETTYTILALDEEYLDRVSVGLWDGGEDFVYASSLKNTSKEKGLELLRALREDVAEATAEDLTGSFPVSRVNVIFSRVPVKESLDNMVPNEKPERYVYGSFHVYPAFHRTLAILKEMGYALDGTDVLKDLKDAQFQIYVRDTNTHSYIGPFPAESDADREEIAECMLPGGFDVSWIRTADAYVVLEGSNQDSEIANFVFTADRVPACVQELLEKSANGELEEEETEIYEGEVLDEVPEFLTVG